jgi:hypothetical protein
MYWPQVGRFLSPDLAGPDPENPATFNRYAYVLNNPYKYVDPTGLWATWTHWAITQQAADSRGFSSSDLRVMQVMHVVVDTDQSSQIPHAMRLENPKSGNPTLTTPQARAALQAFVVNKLDVAIQAARTGRRGDAMERLTEGAHALQDQFAPQHEGYQVWGGGRRGKLLHELSEALVASFERDRQQKAQKATEAYFDLFLDATSGGNRLSPEQRQQQAAGLVLP